MLLYEGGVDSWVAIETYAQTKQRWLQQFLALPKGNCQGTEQQNENIITVFKQTN
ncbi:MAG: transposase family protein [Cyanomargarita calcarea GSE-NOS-MK-12-04C]|jgi:hypothetical protein|uniref:Transposase family protein n=1 Tax=Cyanomargarita calcarea GSE-NOS-MK-12-04C TaxID=2839659 RepID=A0A951QHS5_9CYAN|nr:transposase family protein [Cyanomargarita calcarea GSE-NOS-MK-12-04C]